MNLFDGICGKVAPGLCRLSMNGSIAVRTRNGYRSYDVNSGRLTNCDHFVLDVGEDFFFVMPTNHVEAGDIILAGGTPKCVIAREEHTITAVNFEDATVEPWCRRGICLWETLTCTAKSSPCSEKTGCREKRAPAG